MSFRLLLSALALSVLAAIVPAASASTYTYIYVGAPYDAPFSGQPFERITGYITVDAPLTTGVNFINNPVTYYFSDGTNIYTPGNDAASPYLNLDINSAGAVDNWSLSVLGPFVNGQIAYSFTSAPYDDIAFTGVARPFVSTGLGTWTESSMTPTPEPSTFVLIGTGLLGVAGAARRRLATR